MNRGHLFGYTDELYSINQRAQLLIQRGGMYSMGIDRKDRLWAVDGDNNRIFMLPLTNVTTTAPWNALDYC